MAAYCLSERFKPPPKYFAFYDPGSYQYDKPKLKPNTVPFLSKAPRKSDNIGVLWTQAIYNAAIPHRIPNITSLKSKTSRFPYEAFSAEDLEEILCRCGLENTCECPVSENEPPDEVICQGKVRRRIFKGSAPRSVLGDGGLSSPSTKDIGFDISPSGSQRRMRNEFDNSPDFYDATVNESTAFYHGWKWSQRTSSRSPKAFEVRPGPADYNLEREPTEDEVCAERVRAYKRKTSKQLRFIEIIQQKDISEGRPGPATYSPTMPKGTDLQLFGPKAERFPKSKYTVHPGPADYLIHRDFDQIPPPEVICQATLPERACFGMKSQRFTPQKEEGPSPATYDPKNKLCQFVHCPTTPFLSSAVRFKPDVMKESHDEEIVEIEDVCTKPTWVFKSKTVRMKPTVKNKNEPSPADFLLSKQNVLRSSEYQYAAPFYSSEGRFRAWHNHMPVHGKMMNANHDFYNLEKPKCPSAFHHGPLFRSRRFPMQRFLTPAPNEYEVSGGIETILKTHNKRLADNIQNQHKFVWKQPIETSSLSFEQRESMLLQKCIDLLEPDEENFGKINIKDAVKKVARVKKGTVDKVSAKDEREDAEPSENIDESSDTRPKEDTDTPAGEDAENITDEVKDEVAATSVVTQKPKLLRYFLYSHKVPYYF